MCQCFVDESPRPPDSAHKTWGELLRALDEGLLQDRRLVTAVRFDGVDQPSFRTPELASLGLSTLNRLEVETHPASDVLTETAAAARAGVAVAAQSAREVADALRGIDVKEGNLRLAEIAGVVRQLTMLTVALADTVGTSLEGLTCEDTSAAEIVETVCVGVEQLLAVQQTRDWLSVADCLEFDLAPALDRWSLVFDAVEARVR